jgi:hypothetical protein
MYVYNADVYCDDCGRDIINDCRSKGIRNDGDTDTFPQWASDDEEADSPQHCGGCGCHLGNNLTDDGRDYVRSAVLAGTGDPIVLNEWSSFYGIRKPETGDGLYIFDYDSGDELAYRFGDTFPAEFVTEYWGYDEWRIDEAQPFDGDEFELPGRKISFST